MGVEFGKGARLDSEMISDVIGPPFILATLILYMIYAYLIGLCMRRDSGLVAFAGSFLEILSVSFGLIQFAIDRYSLAQVIRGCSTYRIFEGRLFKRKLSLRFC